MSLGQVLDHPVTRLVIGGFRGLLGVILILAAFIGTNYIGDIKGTIEKLAVQLGEMDGRVDALEKDAAVRAITWETYRKAYEADVAKWHKSRAETTP